MWRAALVTIGLALACRPRSIPLAPAGSRGDHNTPADDGAGGLARQSIQLSVDTTDGSADDHATKPELATPSRYRMTKRVPDPEPAPYGGASYGGRPYGGWRAPALNGNANRTPHYTVVNDLRAAIEGTVTWGGPLPGKLATACGAIDNPMRVGANRALGGALVYIERVSVGRAPNATITHPPQVGGTVVKRGCALIPTVQIATPVPVQLAVHAETRARVVVTSGSGAGKPLDIQEAGRALVVVPSGVTRVEAPDASLVPAWVVVLETPYYAITDDAGHFRIDELAAGTYDVTFWQPPIVTTAHGKLEFGAPVVAHRTVTAGVASPGVASVILGR